MASPAGTSTVSIVSAHFRCLFKRWPCMYLLLLHLQSFQSGTDLLVPVATRVLHLQPIRQPGFDHPSSYIEWQQQQQHPFNGPSPGLPGWAGGISWTICKSAPRSRQITMPVPHHSVFYRPDALPAAQPTASKHWRQFIHRVTVTSFDIYASWFSPPSCG